MSLQCSGWNVFSQVAMPVLLADTIVIQYLLPSKISLCNVYIDTRNPQPPDCRENDPFFDILIRYPVNNKSSYFFFFTRKRFEKFDVV